MRLEANISLSKDGKIPNYKVELKNINSFRFLEKAINCEIARQSEILNKGLTPVQETRGYSESKGTTFAQRVKEEAQDYRYFPEPDIPPITFTEEEINRIKKSLPELPNAKRKKYNEELGLSDYYSGILSSDPEVSSYFEEAVSLASKFEVSVKQIAEAIINKKAQEEYPEPALLVRKLYEITQKTFASCADAENAIGEVIIENQKAVVDYRNGKVQILGFLIGMVQKKLKGEGDPSQIINLLKEKLNL